MDVEKELLKLEEEKQKLIVEKQKEIDKLNEKTRKKEEQLRLKQEKEMTKNAEKEQKEKEKNSIRNNRLNDKDRSLSFTEMREYLEQFPSFPPSFNSAREAKETVDLHLDHKEIACYANPKKFPEKEITWNEWRDINAFWKEKENVLFGILFVIFLFFSIVYFTYWGFIL